MSDGFCTHVPNGPCACDDNSTVKEMFAFLLIDPNDKTEGVPAFQSRQGPLPLMGADIERTKSLRKIAQSLATISNTRIELVKFVQREHVEWIEP